jgi:hypothetical protein
MLSKKANDEKKAPTVGNWSLRTSDDLPFFDEMFTLINDLFFQFINSSNALSNEREGQWKESNVVLEVHAEASDFFDYQKVD